MVSSHCEMDPLCCQENNWEPIEDDDGRDPSSSPAINQLEDDLGVFFASLASRGSELRRRPRRRSGSPDDDPYLCGGGRCEAVGWVLRASARHGFSPATAVLAADYLDRCFLSGDGGLKLQGDRPWMARLSAVSCLSLTAKVEENQVPFLVDLQAAVADDDDDDDDEEAPAGSAAAGGRCGYLFEPRTVRRMELLVLSALQWRMNSVTPFSFLLPLLAGDAAADSGERELLMCCEDVLLSAVADGRWIWFPPSVWAAAALLHAASVDDADRLMNLANSHKESVRECCGLVGELKGRSSNTRSAARRLCGISSNSCGSDCSWSPTPPA